MRPPNGSTASGAAIGIDLGTTYSAAARVNELGKPEILSNRDGENITPSVVLFDERQPIVGTMAKRSVAAAPMDVVQFVKRSMGDPTWRFEALAGSAWRSEEISALILKRLKEDAERTLQTPVTDAVITVPAYFDDAPRRATIDAGTIAGLNVLRVLNEPTAAALAYGVSAGAGGRLLVYDLGGGTFDVTVLQITGHDLQVLATHGDRNLGGFDFDNKLMQLLNERFVAAGGTDLLEDDFTEADLRERAEIAKHSLTSAERTTVTLSADGFTATIPVTRAEFDDVCSSLLSRTRDIAELVLDDAGIAWHQLDRLLLAGGSTRMPMVRDLLSKLSGGAPALATNPDEIVAHGAAIQARILSQEASVAPSRPSTRKTQQTEPTTVTPLRIQVHDVTSHGLGTLLYRRGTDDRYNKVIIPSNTPIPASGSSVSYTRGDGQSELLKYVTEGDDDDPEYVRVLGEQLFPLGGSFSKDTAIETSLNYNADQTVYVKLSWPKSGKMIGRFEIQNVHNMEQHDVVESSMRLRRISPG